jgi:hypothetical protein
MELGKLPVIDHIVPPLCPDQTVHYHVALGYWFNFSSTVNKNSIKFQILQNLELSPRAALILQM